MHRYQYYIYISNKGFYTKNCDVLKEVTILLGGTGIDLTFLVPVCP